LLIVTKMAKLNIKDKVIVPEGVKVTIEGITIKVDGKEGKLERRMGHPMIKMLPNENEVTFSLKNGTKREKMMLKTFKAHLKNMIIGVSEKYTYRLKICSGHFPMSVSKESDRLIVKNFLGEKVPRVAKIIEGVDVEIKGQDITVTCNDKEKAGQTAANIEKSTRLTNKDRRRFQDGIFMTEKAGVDI
jgi:large subunit ribosomal protein L6